MANVVFDIADLYGKVWGGLIFPELIRRNRNNLAAYFKYRENNSNTELDRMPYNALGKPVQSELTISSNEDVMRFTIPPIITIQNSLNVVETVVAGADGTIKEIASVNDYAINIKGFLVDSSYTQVNGETGFSFRINSNQFPEAELRKLRSIFESKKSLDVIESRLLSFFNVKRILIKSINLPELEGYVSVVPFELEAVSDTEYNLILE